MLFSIARPPTGVIGPRRSGHKFHRGSLLYECLAFFVASQPRHALAYLRTRPRHFFPPTKNARRCGLIHYRANVIIIVSSERTGSRKKNSIFIRYARPAKNGLSINRRRAESNAPSATRLNGCKRHRHILFILKSILKIY